MLGEEVRVPGRRERWRPARSSRRSDGRSGCSTRVRPKNHAVGSHDSTVSARTSRISRTTASGLVRVLQLTVLCIAGSARRRDPYRAGRLRLASARRGELGSILAGSPRAAVAVGEDQQVDLPAGGDPLRQRPAGADLGVVRMREDGEHRAGRRRHVGRRILRSRRPLAPARSSTNRTASRTGDAGGAARARSSPALDERRPATSRCAHGVSPTNSARNSAAVMAPP